MTEPAGSEPAGTSAAAEPDDPLAIVRSRRFVVLLALAAAIGLITSLMAWCFLEAIHGIQQFAFTDLPHDLGFDTVPIWWSLPILGIAGLIVAFAIVRLPGQGGHIPADGLSGGTIPPIELTGVLFAALASIGLGVVLGPEAPLIALGGGVGLILVQLSRRDTPPELSLVLGAAGMFAAMSFLFDSPIIAAVILIEAAGLGGKQLPLILIPGLIAAGIGSLVSIGMASFTGLSSSDYAISALQLPSFSRPDWGDIVWTILLAIAVAFGTFLIFRLSRWLLPIMTRRAFLFLPIAGLLISGCAIAFSEVADKGVDQVLFSGQDALSGLAANADAWSVSALALLLFFKGVAWSLSLAGFRGGPTFPAMFLGAAAGVLFTHLPGLELTPAIAVGIAAGVSAVLRLPLSAVVLATLLTAGAGTGSEPLIIVGSAVAYITIMILAPKPPEPDPAAAPALA
jgi:chloride channel protein, CIC family